MPKDTYIVEGLRLLLIGGLWQQVQLWEALLPHLVGFRTIAFDPPGIGASELPRSPYSIRRLARFSAAVLDTVGVGRAHVLGVSLGGVVAQQLARSHPRRVNRLVLVSTTHGVLALPGQPRAMARLMLPTAYASRRNLERRVGVMFGGKMREQPELIHRWDFRPPAGLKAGIFRLVALTGWTSLPWLHTVTAPTLVLHGDDDPIAPLVNARVLASLIPNSIMLVIPGGGHLVLLDSAEQVAPEIGTFLNDLAQQAEAG
jgi:pimeloyl-ACP methyl ester carboxylesterase